MDEVLFVELSGLAHWAGLMGHLRAKRVSIAVKALRGFLKLLLMRVAHWLVYLLLAGVHAPFVATLMHAHAIGRGRMFTQRIRPFHLDF